MASRLLHAGETDVAVIDPAEVHYYQPLWTLVGGGLAQAAGAAYVQPQTKTWSSGGQAFPMARSCAPEAWRSR